MENRKRKLTLNHSFKESNNPLSSLARISMEALAGSSVLPSLRKKPKRQQYLDFVPSSPDSEDSGEDGKLASDSESYSDNIKIRKQKNVRKSKRRRKKTRYLESEPSDGEEDEEEEEEIVSRRRYSEPPLPRTDTFFPESNNLVPQPDKKTARRPATTVVPDKDTMTTMKLDETLESINVTLGRIISASSANKSLDSGKVPSILEGQQLSQLDPMVALVNLKDELLAYEKKIQKDQHTKATFVGYLVPFLQDFAFKMQQKTEKKAQDNLIAWSFKANELRQQLTTACNNFNVSESISVNMGLMKEISFFLDSFHNCRISSTYVGKSYSNMNSNVFDADQELIEAWIQKKSEHFFNEIEHLTSAQKDPVYVEDKPVDKPVEEIQNLQKIESFPKKIKKKLQPKSSTINSRRKNVRKAVDTNPIIPENDESQPTTTTDKKEQIENKSTPSKKKLPSSSSSHEKKSRRSSKTNSSTPSNSSKTNSSTPSNSNKTNNSTLATPNTPSNSSNMNVRNRSTNSKKKATNEEADMETMDAIPISKSTGCSVCLLNNNYKSLLLCDNYCGREFHKFCLDPPLDKIPPGNWYCPHCLEDEQIDPTAVLNTENTSTSNVATAKKMQIDDKEKDSKSDSNCVTIFKCSDKTCLRITRAKYCKAHRCSKPNCPNRDRNRGLCRKHLSIQRHLDNKAVTAEDSSSSITNSPLKTKIVSPKPRSSSISKTVLSNDSSITEIVTAFDGETDG